MSSARRDCLINYLRYKWRSLDFVYILYVHPPHTTYQRCGRGLKGAFGEHLCSTSFGPSSKPASSPLFIISSPCHFPHFPFSLPLPLLLYVEAGREAESFTRYEIKPCVVLKVYRNLYTLCCSLLLFVRFSEQITLDDILSILFYFKFSKKLTWGCWVAGLLLPACNPIH